MALAAQEAAPLGDEPEPEGIRVDAFIAYLTAPLRRRRARPNTARSYRSALAGWSRWLSEQGPDGAWAVPNAESAQAYLEERVALGKADKTVQLNATAIQRYLQWTGEKDERNNPVELEYPRQVVSNPPKFYYTLEEVQAFVEAGSLIARTFASLMFDTACRYSEIAALRLSDVHLDGEHPFLDVTLKGGRRDIAVLTERGAGILREWLDRSRANRSKTLPALDRMNARETAQMIEKKPWDVLVFGTWTYPKVHKELAYAAARAHLRWGNGVASHVMRHSRAVHLLQQGVPLDRVGQVLHHANPRTTKEVYGRFLPGDLAKELKVW